MVERKTYLNQLVKLRDQHLIKVLTGIRRCGKSTLMQSFREYLLNGNVPEKRIFSLNFEEREAAEFSCWENVYDHIMGSLSSGGMRYVFLDEVQTLPHFEKLVDALFVKSDIDLYITGSNAFLLSSELGTLLSGRYIAIGVHPFSFSEYVASFGDGANPDRLFRQYLNSSCFPEAVNISKATPDMESEYLRALYDTVVVKDIVGRHHLRKFDTLYRVVNFLFDNVGSVVSPNNIADVLTHDTGSSTSHNTVQKYLRYFSESYLIYPVQLYNVKGKRLLSSNYKYYVADLGLRNILNTNHPDADLGHKLENVVYFELLRRGGLVYAGRAGNQEVDFVVMKPGGGREYYQVAYTANDEKTLSRELSSLRKIRDTHPKYLLTTDFDTSNYDGIQKLNVIDWLLA